ncbi:MAG: tRNA lysidine(34) synthetase TilS [Candidatus Omnitrophica bacterium]|nr:tRNA lysidine(34) synthetase TilS [Candidatus Omnitrophota bacterium]
MNPIQLLNRIRTTIRRFDMLRKNDRVLVCVSGGPDSMCLLHALVYFKKEWSLSLAVAHLDHGIRGRVSYEDLLFVKKTAAESDIPFFSKRIKISKVKGRSLEETAREKRYAFFNDVAMRHTYTKIATGHTLSDQAETVLMRIIKGTSIKGLTGIPPTRNEDGRIFIRPLIETARSEVMAFLRCRKARYRLDRTNEEDIYFRNSVRNKVIPYLRRYNPQIERSLANLALSLREDRAFLEGEKNGLPCLWKVRNNGMVIDLKDFVIHPQTLQKEIMRDCLIRAGANIKKFTYEHWKGIRYLVSRGRNGASIDLPGKIVLAKRQTSLCIAKNKII